MRRGGGTQVGRLQVAALCGDEGTWCEGRRGRSGRGPAGRPGADFRDPDERLEWELADENRAARRGADARRRRHRQGGGRRRAGCERLPGGVQAVGLRRKAILVRKGSLHISAHVAGGRVVATIAALAGAFGVFFVFAPTRRCQFRVVHLGFLQFQCTARRLAELRGGAEVSENDPFRAPPLLGLPSQLQRAGAQPAALPGHDGALRAAAGLLRGVHVLTAAARRFAHLARHREVDHVRLRGERGPCAYQGLRGVRLDPPRLRLRQLAAPRGRGRGRLPALPGRRGAASLRSGRHEPERLCGPRGDLQLHASAGSDVRRLTG
mmetsp:Transcript_23140/g.74776  ORF Transcript_23140/g.74776 Transcript_23140/m.74776 type:complete len:322 (+) Transcript_23140:3276-4241(+)